MDKSPTFYQLALVTLLSFLLTNAFLHPKKDREFRTVFLVSETLWFMFLSATRPLNDGNIARRERQRSIWMTVMFLYFIHTHEYVHPNYLE